MSRCLNERRLHSRRCTDRSTGWKLMVTMGLLFIGWSALVYIHWLISMKWWVTASYTRNVKVVLKGWCTQHGSIMTGLIPPYRSTYYLFMMAVVQSGLSIRTATSPGWCSNVVTLKSIISWIYGYDCLSQNLMLKRHHGNGIKKILRLSGQCV